MGIASFFVLLGSVILIGVFGNFFFHKTRVPNPVILLLVGIVLGPVTGLIKASELKDITPYFGTLALILILFEGGLDLDIRAALTQGRSALAMGLLTYFFSVFGILVFTKLFLGVGTSTGLMYGLVLAGTSPAIILPILQKMNLTKEAHTLFALESVVSEVLTVTLATLSLDVLTSPEARAVGTQAYFAVHAIGISVVIAVLFGWGWNWVLPYIEKLGLSHMLTLACLFFMYAISHALKGEAALSILLFGLLLENGPTISSHIRSKVSQRFHFLIEFSEINEKKIFSSVFSEITFLVRTFFFVLMGLIVSFQKTNVLIWIFALCIIVFLFGVRKGCLSLVQWISPKFERDSGGIGEVFISRGLATAVIALSVSEQMPEAEALVQVAFLVILGTNLVMSFRVRKFI